MTNSARSLMRPFGLALIAAMLLPQVAGAQMQPADGSLMTPSKLAFDDTVSTLQQAIEGHNLMVIQVVDGQKMLRMAGKQVNGMKQIFYFHPTYMKRVMEANAMATIQIPLKIIVMEKPDGKVVLRYFKPSTLLNQYKGEEAIAQELDGIVDEIVSSVAKR